MVRSLILCERCCHRGRFRSRHAAGFPRSLAAAILTPVAVAQPLATSDADGVLARAWKNAQGVIYVGVVNELIAPVANVSDSRVAASDSMQNGW